MRASTVTALAALAGLVWTTASPVAAQPASPGPGDSADMALRPYAAGVLSTVNGISFEADGRTVYLTRRVADSDDRGRPRVRIFRHRRVGSAWSDPSPLPFPGEYTDYQPVLSPDGTRLFFTSTRPLPGTKAEARQNIWFAERAGGDWGEPRVVPELATAGWDGHAVPTRSGRLYFISDRPGGSGGTDIWLAEPAAAGRFGTPVNVTELNSEHGESDLYVDPDERFLIFNRYVDSTRALDLWISVRRGARWPAPRPLTEINGPGWELSPTVSPDGRYLYFHLEGVLQRIRLGAVLTPAERRLLEGPA